MKSKSIIDELIGLVKDFQNDQKVEYFSGQKKGNLVFLGKDSNSGPNFEFGDLRVEFENARVIVEVDTAGGITNLAKYFFMLNKPDDFNFEEIEPKNQRKKYTYLLHIFVCLDDTDYRAHRELWCYINESLKANNFNPKIKVWYTKQTEIKKNEQVKTKFEKLLNEASKK